MPMLTKRYDKFAGVDFSADPTAINATRSPYALNIMPDSGGLPEKRIGWRVVRDYGANINGIFAFGDTLIIHAGDKIYADDVLLIQGVNDGKSCGCAFCDKLWLLTGEEFLVYDGETLSNVSDIATPPQVLSQTNNYLDGGYTYQPFNMLTTRRQVGITIPENGMNEIVIPQRADRFTLKLYFKNTGEDLDILRKEPEDWDTESPVLRIRLRDTYYPTMVGDEVILEYQLEEEREKIIQRCTFIAAYENRLFVGGNPDYPNYDFHSELNDGTYFSDVSYTNIGNTLEAPDADALSARAKDTIGTGGTKILGYSYVGRYLGIHKNGAGEGATLYLRRGEMTEAGMIFPVTEGIVGEAMVTPFATATLIDDPLFLTKNGVKAIGSADITNNNCIQTRSTRVDPKLTCEELESAVSCIWRGFYLLFTGGRVYLADSRQKSYPRNLSNHFEYEWYLWDNVPARAVCADGDALYFGDEAGRLCRFNSDLCDAHGNPAMEAYNDDGEAICAYWSTKMDDDGDFSTLKLLSRRGSGVYVKSYSAGDVQLLVRTERDFGKPLNYKKLGLFDFRNLNFSNFTFNTLPFSFVPFSRKVKDYRMLQVILKNDALNQSLGVVAIEWQYKKGRFAK